MQASSEGKFTPLAHALMCRDLEKMKALLEDGADPNERLPRGQSLVWLAATYSDPRFLPLLVSHGGNLEGHEDRMETSALAGGMTAGFQLGVWDNYYFALDAGADPNIRYGNPPSVTVAEKAIGLGLFDKALELLDRGYHNDLDKLARFARQRPIDASSSQAAYKEKLLRRLAAR